MKISAELFLELDKVIYIENSLCEQSPKKQKIWKWRAMGDI